MTADLTEHYIEILKPVFEAKDKNLFEYACALLHAPLKNEELMAEGGDLKKDLGTVSAEVLQEGKKKAE